MIFELLLLNHNILGLVLYLEYWEINLTKKKVFFVNKRGHEIEMIKKLKSN